MSYPNVTLNNIDFNSPSLSSDLKDPTKIGYTSNDVFNVITDGITPVNKTSLVNSAGFNIAMVMALFNKKNVGKPDYRIEKAYIDEVISNSVSYQNDTDRTTVTPSGVKIEKIIAPTPQNPPTNTYCEILPDMITSNHRFGVQSGNFKISYNGISTTESDPGSATTTSLTGSSFKGAQSNASGEIQSHEITPIKLELNYSYQNSIVKNIKIDETEFLINKVDDNARTITKINIKKNNIICYDGIGSRSKVIDITNEYLKLFDHNTPQKNHNISLSATELFVQNKIESNPITKHYKVSSSVIDLDDSTVGDDRKVKLGYLETNGSGESVLGLDVRSTLSKSIFNTDFVLCEKLFQDGRVNSLFEVKDGKITLEHRVSNNTDSKQFFIDTNRELLVIQSLNTSKHVRLGAINDGNYGLVIGNGNVHIKLDSSEGLSWSFGVNANFKLTPDVLSLKKSGVEAEYRINGIRGVKFRNETVAISGEVYKDSNGFLKVKD